VAVPLLVAVTAVAVPDAALAAPAGGVLPGRGTLTPLVDCVRSDGSGVFTAVLGYDNGGTATRHLTGRANRLTPSRYDGAQPTTFASGPHHGVLSLRSTDPTVSWTLDGTTVVASADSPACPAGHDLPADGNGSGATVVLVVAGLVGAALAVRLQREHRMSSLLRRSGDTGTADREEFAHVGR
jgi:hypothetical protein